MLGEHQVDPATRREHATLSIGIDESLGIGVVADDRCGLCLWHRIGGWQLVDGMPIVLHPLG